MSTFRLATFWAAALWLGAAVMPAAARADTDACKLLSPAEVGTAVGAPVGPGEYVTPGFVKTCTWRASGSSDVKFVTLELQTTATYDGGKQMANQLAAMGKRATMQAAGIGVDSYYFVLGDQVGLLVKTASVAFKLAVYATLPVDRKEGMELGMAKLAAARL
jgi:hypothetical protein